MPGAGLATAAMARALVLALCLLAAVAGVATADTPPNDGFTTSEGDVEWPGDAVVESDDSINTNTNSDSLNTPSWDSAAADGPIETDTSDALTTPEPTSDGFSATTDGGDNPSWPGDAALTTSEDSTDTTTGVDDYGDSIISDTSDVPPTDAASRTSDYQQFDTFDEGATWKAVDSEDNDIFSYYDETLGERDNYNSADYKNPHGDTNSYSGWHTDTYRTSDSDIYASYTDTRYIDFADNEGGVVTDESFWGDLSDTTGDYDAGFSGDDDGVDSDSVADGRTNLDWDTYVYGDSSDEAGTRWTIDSGVDSSMGSANCADGDGDGVCDHSDNCPDDANADQANADGDAMGDACDDDDMTMTDCRFAAESGVYRVEVAPGMERLVYCDAEQDPPAASVFYLDDATDFMIDRNSVQCVLRYLETDGYWSSSGVDDSIMMWADGSMVAGTNGADSYHIQNNNYRRWLPDGTETDRGYVPGVKHLPHEFRIEGGLEAYPIPFYASGKTAWFSFQSNALWWDGLDAPLRFRPLLDADTFECFQSEGTESSTWVVTTDGVNTATVGNFDDSDGCARTFVFNFHENTVAASSPASEQNDDNYDEVDRNVFGDQLATVNGRVLRWYDSDTFILDGPAYDPFEASLSEEGPAQSYDEPMAHDGGSYEFDWFARVDENNMVWFGHRDSNEENAFGCNHWYEGEYIVGAVATNVHALNFGPGGSGGCGPGRAFDEVAHKCVVCDAAAHMCPFGTYESAPACNGWSAEPTCTPCDDSCSGCDGPSSSDCLGCGAGFFDAGDCSGACEPCEVGCASCTGTRRGDCEACAHGWHYNEEAGICVEGPSCLNGDEAQA